VDDQEQLPSDGVASGLPKLEGKSSKDPQDQLEEIRLDGERAAVESLRENIAGRRADRHLRSWLLPAIAIVCIVILLACLAIFVFYILGKIVLNTAALAVIGTGFLAGGYGLCRAVVIALGSRAAASSAANTPPTPATPDGSGPPP